MQILLIEDHDALRLVLEQKLIESGCQVKAVSCLEELYEAPLESKDLWDIALLDVNLPGRSGFEIAKHLKEVTEKIHIIMMTARTEIKDKLMGYQSGADYYLPKPIDYQEILAILGVIQQKKQILEQQKITYLYLNQKTKLLTSAQGLAIKLSQTEADMLLAFIMADQQNLAYWQLYLVLNLQENTDKNTLEAKVCRLRKKLEIFQVSPKPIQTVRGEGYQMSLKIKLN